MLSQASGLTNPVPQVSSTRVYIQSLNSVVYRTGFNLGLLLMVKEWHFSTSHLAEARLPEAFFTMKKKLPRSSYIPLFMSHELELVDMPISRPITVKDNEIIHSPSRSIL